MSTTDFGDEVSSGSVAIGLRCSSPTVSEGEVVKALAYARATAPQVNPVATAPGTGLKMLIIIFK